MFCFFSYNWVKSRSYDFICFVWLHVLLVIIMDLVRVAEWNDTEV